MRWKVGSGSEEERWEGKIDCEGGCGKGTIGIGALLIWILGLVSGAYKVGPIVFDIDIFDTEKDLERSNGECTVLILGNGRL